MSRARANWCPKPCWTTVAMLGKLEKVLDFDNRLGGWGLEGGGAVGCNCWASTLDVLVPFGIFRWATNRGAVCGCSQKRINGGKWLD